MAAIEKADPDELGVKMSGSPRTGQKVELGREGALRQIFGTSDNKQADVLLSHCIKALKSNEVSDEYPGNDERIFMLSIIRDMAPRDAVERMLAVQMAMKDDDNPMSKAHEAPRCTANSKRTGERCKGPAVKGWRVCRFHGAGGGHKSGTSHPSWQHGMRSREWIEVRAEINALVREAREIERMLFSTEAR